jgi:hypothetical protein
MATEGGMASKFRRGDRAKVVTETGDPRFPLGTIVVVVEALGGFGPGPHTVEVYREGKANVVEGGLKEDVLEKVGR